MQYASSQDFQHRQRWGQDPQSQNLSDSLTSETFSYARFPLALVKQHHGRMARANEAPEREPEQ